MLISALLIVHKGGFGIKEDVVGNFGGKAQMTENAEASAKRSWDWTEQTGSQAPPIGGCLWSAHVKTKEALPSPRLSPLLPFPHHDVSSRAGWGSMLGPALSA